jgi:hypothetical protein
MDVNEHEKLSNFTQIKVKGQGLYCCSMFLQNVNNGDKN